MGNGFIFNAILIGEKREMNLIMGIIPCKDRFFLDKALSVVKPGLEELSNQSNGETTYYGIVTELYSGTMQISMAYIDNDNTPDGKEQLTVMQKMLTDAPLDYAGFSIFQLWQNSFHVFAAYLVPQYRNGALLRQGFEKVEKQARLLGAPYISLCTREHELVKRLGFIETYATFRKKL